MRLRIKMRQKIKIAMAGLTRGSLGTFVEISAANCNT